MKFAVGILSGLLFLTGCSADTKPDYDPVKLIEYQACLDHINEGESDYRTFAYKMFYGKDYEFPEILKQDTSTWVIDWFEETKALCLKYRP
jgi:hypothetical protein